MTSSAYQRRSASRNRLTCRSQRLPARLPVHISPAPTRAPFNPPQLLREHRLQEQQLFKQLALIQAISTVAGQRGLSVSQQLSVWGQF